MASELDLLRHNAGILQSCLRNVFYTQNMEWMKAMIVDITKYRIEQLHVYNFEDEAKNIIDKADDALRANKRLQDQLGEKEKRIRDLENWITDKNRGGRLANPQDYNQEAF